MRRSKRENTAIIIFVSSLILILLICAMSIMRTNEYNREVHYELFSGDELYSEEVESEKEVTIKAIPRSNTWTKIFESDSNRYVEKTYRAFTYDFSVSNNTGDSVSDFKIKVMFDKEAYLMSAWNGSLEIHQSMTGGEYVATIPDLREFKKEDYSFDTYTIDGETLIKMKQGDYLIYIPCANVSALEVPIEAYEGTVPGIIMYIADGEDLTGSDVELQYTFHRLIISDRWFWISMTALLAWFVALTIYVITSLQIRKYKLRHERDNEIIMESIETFTGFIDAKDPYTNGHSNRVAEYTKRIASEMGYSGEELDRIYYIALLHDCGKIGVPDNILGKPAKLTEDEFEVIKSHTVCGGEILSSFKSLKDVGEGALYHHERYDGNGYPEGRAGEDIPLIARMICVADSYDAMNSDRVYRKRLSKEKIIEEITECKGKQFDPKIADIALRLIKEGKI